MARQVAFRFLFSLHLAASVADENGLVALHAVSRPRMS
jgi:hypothetical protein